MTNFERRFEPTIELTPEKKDVYEDKDRKKLEEISKKIAEEYRQEGIPVDDKLRIDMGAFKGIYSENEIEKHRNDIKERRQKWLEELKLKNPYKSDMEIEEMVKEKEIEAENLEMLIPIICYKLRKEGIIVVRTSEQDDFINKGGDIIILDKKNATIGVLDVSQDVSRENEFKKRKNFKERNNNGGTSLNYGLNNKKEGDIVVKQKRVPEIPLFYFLVDSKEVRRGMRELLFSSNEISQFENELLISLFKAMRNQSDYIKEFGRDPTIKNKLRNFDKSLYRVLTALSRK